MVEELAPKGDLCKLLMSHGKFSEPVARFFFKQILEALDYLHTKRRVAHRDIKPANILLDQDYGVKVADFGLATRVAGKQGDGWL